MQPTMDNYGHIGGAGQHDNAPLVQTVLTGLNQDEGPSRAAVEAQTVRYGWC